MLLYDQQSVKPPPIYVVSKGSLTYHFEDEIEMKNVNIQSGGSQRGGKKGRRNQRGKGNQSGRGNQRGKENGCRTNQRVRANQKGRDDKGGGHKKSKGDRGPRAAKCYHVIISTS